MTKIEKKSFIKGKKPPKDSVRMNINVPRVFYKEIQHIALDKDITITELVITAIKSFINKKKN